MPLGDLVEHMQGTSQTAAELGQRWELSIAKKLRPARSLLQQCCRNQCPQADTCHPVVTRAVPSFENTLGRSQPGSAFEKHHYQATPSDLKKCILCYTLHPISEKIYFLWLRKIGSPPGGPVIARILALALLACSALAQNVVHYTTSARTFSTCSIIRRSPILLH